MEKEERIAKAGQLAASIDLVNDLDFAHTEAEDDILKEAVSRITNTTPLLWSEKSGNRQQCYSIMFSKLLLAYLISEIKEGNILPKEYLEKIKDCRLETFFDFFYDEDGYKITSVLTGIVEQVIEQDGIFYISEDFMDTSAVREAEYRDDYGDSGDEEDEAMADCILETCPKLGLVTDKAELIKDVPLITCYLSVRHDVETFMVEINSAILYDIIKREEKYPTELGKNILEMYRGVLKKTLQQDELYMSLEWILVDDEDKKVSCYIVTGSDILGDDCYYPTYACERLHTYRYGTMFKYMELQRYIKEYRQLYLQ